MLIELWYIWIGLGIIFIIAEMLIPRFWMLSIGLASILAGLISLLTNSVIFQAAVFTVSIFVNFAVIKAVSGHILHPVRKKSDCITADIVGLTGVVVSRIAPDKPGEISIGGNRWPALPQSNITIDSSTIVIISEIRANTAIVKPDAASG